MTYSGNLFLVYSLYTTKDMLSFYTFFITTVIIYTTTITWLSVIVLYIIPPRVTRSLIHHHAARASTRFLFCYNTVRGTPLAINISARHKFSAARMLHKITNTFAR